jgi:hypothetical protein
MVKEKVIVTACYRIITTCDIAGNNKLLAMGHSINWTTCLLHAFVGNESEARVYTYSTA